MYSDRISLYKALAAKRQGTVLVLVTGDRAGWETVIAPDVIDPLADHLDAMGTPRKVSLILYTRGGHTLAAWNIVHLIRQFCDEFEVIVPRQALSAGTLIALGADRIMMTKQATLGPIDPSIHTPLNPPIPGGAPQAKVPVSVEEVKGFLDMAREEMGTSDSSLLLQAYLSLAQQVPPLVLGRIYRTRAQIRLLARQLITRQLTDKDAIDKVVAFLTSESGSHDYTINRKEAREQLGLNMEKPDDETYKIIKTIYEDIRKELLLGEPYDPTWLLAASQSHSYSFKRCLVESVEEGCHAFISNGTLTKRQVPTPQGIMEAIDDQRSFEGWRKMA